jgi:hypothetical protein
MSNKRVDLKKILSDPNLRRKLMVSAIRATQAREGIETTVEQANRAYYVVTEGEKTAFFDLDKFKPGKGQSDLRQEMFVKTLIGVPSQVRFDVARRDFRSIEGSPLAYQALGTVAPIFKTFPSLGSRWADVQGGMNSTESERFIRYRWEVGSLGNRNWMPFSKGGAFARFYTDIDLVLDWTDHGAEYKKVVKDKYGSASRFVKSESYYGRPGITWTEMTSKGLNAKRLPAGCIFNCKGPCAFPKDEKDSSYLLGILNSKVAHALMKCLTSRSYGSTYVAQLPIPIAASAFRQAIAQFSESIFKAKLEWSKGDETSSEFVSPWLAQHRQWHAARGIRERLTELVSFEKTEDQRIQSVYDELNDTVFRLYSFPAPSRDFIEELIGERPPEVIWPEMEGRSADQKRMEHVWRLLSFAVKRVVEADDDGVVPLLSVDGETSLADRVHVELAKLFPQQDINEVEIEIVNELKRKVKGYDRAESIREWIENVYFAYHASLYKNRPIFWHIASKQGKGPAAFSALVHYHRFDRDRMAKLRGGYLREALTVFRREAALASQEGRTDDRLEWQAKVEEAEELDRRLQMVQEGFHNGSVDYRILTPWKTEAQRPNGWNPDINDGVKVNIAPLQRAGVLRIPQVVTE